MDSLFSLDKWAYLRVSRNRLQKENNYLIADENDTDKGKTYTQIIAYTDCVSRQ